MLPISICMIAKNEEKYIGDCLNALVPLQEAGAELIVTDTGSTDKTISIAKQFKAGIFSFHWQDDFSAARNFCASRASHDWILFLDCDEFLLPDKKAPGQIISEFLAQYTPRHAGSVTIKSPTLSGQTAVDHLARFYHRFHYQYNGRIHEQLGSLSGQSPAYAPLSLSFYHAGYGDSLRMPQKLERNLALLEKDYQNNPADSYTLFQLGQTLRLLKRQKEALFYFEQALSLDLNPALDYVKTLVDSYGYTLLDLNMPKKALELSGVYDTFCDRADFVFLMGTIFMQNGLFEEAIREYKKAVTIPFYSVEGTNSYSAYYNIGVIYECLGHVKEALSYYEKCGNYPPAQKRIRLLCGTGS